MPDRKLVTTIASRANLVRILDNLKEGIIAHDMQRRIFFFNAEAERITGYNREEVLGRDCHEVFGGPFCGQRCSFCDGGPILHENAAYPLNIASKNGDFRRIEFRTTMMRGEDGDYAGVLASFTDVTQLLELQRRSDEMNRFANIIGGDVKMRAVYQQIVDVAQYDFPVHLFGETGTGKELVANAVHNESRRGGAPFVPINCGALPEGLIESELFGHVKGAFSGAIRDKKGRFELARRRYRLSRRGGRIAQAAAGQTAAFPPGGQFRKSGRRAHRRRRCARHQRHEQRPQAGGAGAAPSGRISSTGST